MMIVATDGACKGNPGPAGWGYIREDGEWAQGCFLNSTNNVGELFAIVRVLYDLPQDVDVTIQTDSAYAIDCLTKWHKNWSRNGWKNSKGEPVKNADLIKSALLSMKARDGSVTFEKVKGHSGHPMNEVADRLASDAALLGVDKLVRRGSNFDEDYTSA